MIDLHERLSEFSYGYGVSREVEDLLASVGLRPTPFLPSLLHEAQLGFDVKFQDLGRIVVLQFKLGEELKRFHRTDPTQSIPSLSRPFWRYKVDTTGHQFRLLEDLETRHSDVYYVAPRFSSWQEYDKAFQEKKVLENSLILKPSEINRGISQQGAAPGVHRIAYDGWRRYVCSEPVELIEQRPRQMAHEIAANIRNGELVLEAQVERLFSRPMMDDDRGVLDPGRRDDLFGRARRPVDAMAAAIGIEAWSVGAQVIFVTADSAG